MLLQMAWPKTSYYKKKNKRERKAAKSSMFSYIKSSPHAVYFLSVPLSLSSLHKTYFPADRAFLQMYV